RRCELERGALARRAVGRSIAAPGDKEHEQQKQSFHEPIRRAPCLPRAYAPRPHEDNSVVAPLMRACAPWVSVDACSGRAGCDGPFPDPAERSYRVSMRPKSGLSRAIETDHFRAQITLVACRGSSRDGRSTQSHYRLVLEPESLSQVPGRDA